MGQDQDMWAGMRKDSQEKKAHNEKWSMEFLKNLGLDFQVLDAGSRHYRVNDYDFWPSTGVFYNQQTGEKGRGVRNLVRIIMDKKHGKKI